MVDVLMHGERHLRVRAVDGARRREHQMLDAVVAAAFEHSQRALNIAVDVRERRLDAVANAGLRAEMNDASELLRCEQLCHRFAIGEIELDELEVLASAEDLEPSVLQRDVVVLIEVVETDHLVAALEQCPRRMKTNESGGACNED